mmetsp:Transcript_31438/g.47938  ORF Transcript_31438/g.47938 Transcript_31438/m.47938 type:complete len:232 (-) Transcript_31438:37-732(-)
MEDRSETTLMETPEVLKAQPAKLFPLRIDATASNGNVRIIDTLLFDSNCWPIPLSKPLNDSVEANVRHIANFIISDAEVIGMGRTVRHFTNRVDLWSLELQEKVEEQLRSQIWDILGGGREALEPKENIVKISLRLTVNNVLINDDFDWDTSVPMCPIEFANTMAKELNLPIEAPVVIATSIVEQLNGIKISSGQISTGTSAKIIDSRDQVANLAHVVALHRPAALDERTS